MEGGTKYVPQRALTPLYFGECLGWLRWWSLRESRKASNQVKECRLQYDAHCNKRYLSGRALLGDPLAHVRGEGHRGIGLLVRDVQVEDQLEDAESWRLQHACEAKVVCFRLRKTAGSLKSDA